MQRILIIAYFYPPCNLTAAQRPHSWSLYLSESGYYPIIVTRRWDKEINTPVDAYQKTGDEIIHEKTDKYEIYRLPYCGSLRDRIYLKYGEDKFVFIRKFLTYAELAFQPFFNFFIPYNNIYTFSKKLLKKDSDIKKMIITANPYVLFKFGYLINKKYKTSWIADYRDDWNTQEISKRNTVFKKSLYLLESYFEKKWVGSASAITSISHHYTQKISKFVNKNGFVIMNGYSEETNTLKNIGLFPDFTIVYSGTLYEIQNIEIFLHAMIRMIDDFKGDIKIKFLLPGVAYDKKQAERIKKIMRNYESYVEITERVSKKNVLEIERKSHLLLMVGYGNLIGIPSSKLFEYISLVKPVLLCPSDNDIIENTLRKTGLGYFADNPQMAYEYLCEFYELFCKNTAIPVNPDYDEINKLSRKSQTRLMAEIIDEIT